MFFFVKRLEENVLALSKEIQKPEATLPVFHPNNYDLIIGRKFEEKNITYYNCTAADVPVLILKKSKTNYFQKNKQLLHHLFNQSSNQQKAYLKHSDPFESTLIWSSNFENKIQQLNQNTII